MKNLWIIAVIFLLGCGRSEQKGDQDISLSADDIISGLDQELQEEIADYAFLDADPDNFYNRIWKLSYVAKDGDTVSLENNEDYSLWWKDPTNNYFIFDNNSVMQIRSWKDSIYMAEINQYYDVIDSFQVSMSAPNLVRHPLWRVKDGVAKTSGFFTPSNLDSLVYYDDFDLVMIDLGIDLPSVQEIKALATSTMLNQPRNATTDRNAHKAFSNGGFDTELKQFP